MIRDHIVVGLQGATLSEKLQLDPDLTLKKTIAMVCKAETVKSQQAFVSGKDANNMDSPIIIGRIGKGKPRQEQRIRREAKNSYSRFQFRGTPSDHQHIIDSSKGIQMQMVRRVIFKWCVGLEPEWKKSKPISKNHLSWMVRYQHSPYFLICTCSSYALLGLFPLAQFSTPPIHHTFSKSTI